MKKYYKFILFLKLTPLLIVLIGEGIFRFLSKTDPDEIRYKQIHCLYDFSEIRLCPNRNESFIRKDGKIWDIQTNDFGERILSNNIESTNLWLIGDSMAMGYGLPTNETPSFYLKSKYKIDVRLLAVDAIGTNGILRILKDSLKFQKSEKHPEKIYWIWNPSDFIDDEREKVGIKRYLYPIHYLLVRNSYFYRFLLPTPPANKYTSYGNPILYPKSHITYSNLRKFFSDPLVPKEKLTILFSWGMAGDGHPDTKDLNYEMAKEFFKEQDVKTIDLRTKTLELYRKKKPVYIPSDGHPGPALAELFADAIAKHFLNLP
ncbi:hypothetical protein ND861_13670 [Leptospira sp. 2 VSF19]|uniref:SGNH/GDSL hydrolase family protein n=1 Tax=Leptospira soteropolitanensis TaxID=2950025 RepID=A0AAW5VMR8_9LEPT|nr:hypothetical protein [Leptospira soteropolitanensis]MCW7493694.1 hypothetical protein [Leptospira soteropolitanensis]MCW7501292.1 hypothetical protein [Leptospira soteropolitanensis]MCW7523522.1 hypothetical protein [Leptospira soteropolitanensis]MCW7527406.1 hypothetical protein [Leptospira soteropolitanensis]MCW7531262.1 hypothetical protein [Leptospira soteropolitanensis]